MCPWLLDDPVPEIPDRDPDGLDGPDAPVWAMPLILRMERPGGPVEPPTRTALLEAAAAAALALCLDDRAAPDGPWYDAVATWAGAGRIRKVARRARTSHWRGVDEVEGLTIGRAGAEVRALVPGDVDDVPQEVRRLQIGGTDLPDDSADAAAPPPERAVIWLNPGVEQSTGKAAAQVGHASMILAVVLAASGADPAPALDAAVRTASGADWEIWSATLGQDGSGREAWVRHGVSPVRDAGFTEVAAGTVTCMAQGVGPGGIRR